MRWHTPWDRTYKLAADLYECFRIGTDDPRWADLTEDDRQRWCRCAEFVEKNLRLR